MKTKRMITYGDRWALTASLLTPFFVFIVSSLMAGLAFMVPTALASQTYVNARLYLYGTLAQFLMDIPAVVLLFRSRWSLLGSRRERRQGLIIGIAAAVAAALVRILVNGPITFMRQVPAFDQGLTLPVPWNLLSSAFTILAYGPGEALIQVYLILAFDRAVNQHDRTFSLGVFANAILWGLGHVAAIISLGWVAIGNALIMFAVGILTGVMFKETKSATAPMVFWTLVNGTSV